MRAATTDGSTSFVILATLSSTFPGIFQAHTLLNTQLLLSKTANISSEPSKYIFELSIQTGYHLSI